MKKILSFLMMCVLSIVFTGALTGCDANGNNDSGTKVKKQTDVEKEETDIEDNQ